MNKITSYAIIFVFSSLVAIQVYKVANLYYQDKVVEYTSQGLAAGLEMKVALLHRK